MARTTRADGQDAALEEAYAMVSHALGEAVRETIERHDPDAARSTVRRLTSIDDDYADSDEPPPGWSLAFLVLAGWFDVAREALAEHPDRSDRALGWIEEHLGRRARLRAGYTIAPLTSVEDARETSHYVEALGVDYLASMVWAAAAVTDLYPSEDGDRNWLRTRADAQR